MELRKTELSAPVKFIVTETQDVIKEKKKQIYETRIQPTLKVPGFREGTVPQEIGEQKINLMDAYKPIIDEMVLEIQKNYNIVYFKDFKVPTNIFSGDFSFEFVGEIKPEIKSIDSEMIKLRFDEMNYDVTEEDVESEIQSAIKEKSTVEPTEKIILDNFDVAYIDFVGNIVGENDAFKGGSAKDYEITVNQVTNGQKQFIDNFEDQLVGMSIGQTKDVFVKFPDDYRDTTKAGKQARFVVTLNTIKVVVKPSIDEVMKLKGFDSLDSWKTELRKTIGANKKTSYENGYRQDVIRVAMNATNLSPIPQGMIDNELEHEWNKYLNRINKTEKDYVKEHKFGKEHFKANTERQVKETIKLGIVLDYIAKTFDITVTKEEIIEQIKTLSVSLNYSESMKERMIKDLDTNVQQYEFLERTTKNDKTVKYLVDACKENKRLELGNGISH